MTDRQKEALTIKGKNRIYLEIVKDDMPNMCIVADLGIMADENGFDEDFNPDDYGEMPGIPDYTPDWLYNILDLWDASEEMESYFVFDSPEDIEEFRKICDVVIDN